MSDTIKKRRKTATININLERTLVEYPITLSEILSLLKDGYLKAQGKWDNDFSMPKEHDQLRYQKINKETWEGLFTWEFNKDHLHLTNEDLQSYSSIRFNRKDLEKAIYQHYDPKKVAARLYNWELIALQICAYMHEEPLPNSKIVWFKLITEQIPYFRNRKYKPNNAAMDKHLGIVWDALNKENVDWDQHVI